MKLLIPRPSLSLFARFLLTYVVLLSIPLLLAVFVSNELIGEFQATIENSQLALLRQTRQVVEQSIDDLEWRVFQMAGNPRISRLSTEYRSSGRINMSLVRETIGYLHTYSLYSRNLRNTFYIYLKEPEIILTPFAMYRHEDFTDRRTYLQIEGTTLEEWNPYVLSKYYRRKFLPARRVTIEDFTNKPMIPYIQSIPVGTTIPMTRITGALVFFIDEEEFASLLENIALPKGGWAYIADENDEIISSIANEAATIEVVGLQAHEDDGLFRQPINGQDMFVVHTRSGNGWTYVAVLPAQPIIAPVLHLQQITYVSLVLTVFIAMIVASYISYRRAQPLQRLIETLRDISSIEVGDGSSIQALNSGVRNLISESRHLENELSRQEAFHENLLVRRLLQGSFRNQNEMQSFLSYLKIEIRESCFAAAIISLSGFNTLESVDMIDQMNQSKVVLKDLLRRAVEGRVLLYDSNEESLSIIGMSRRTGTSDFFRRLVEQLRTVTRRFEEVYHDRLDVGVGGPRTDILSISDSYEEARLALAGSSAAREAAIVVYSDNLKNEQGYYFPIELEVKIINATRAGDIEALEGIFDVFISENFRQRRISGLQVRYLHQELFGAYQKLLSGVKFDLPGEIPAADMLDDGVIDFESQVKQLIEYFYVMAVHTRAVKRSHNQTLINRIVRYIDDHYADHDLGLYAVSSKFSITESYLSFFFKEQLGENFSTYIEKVRIEKAVSLLKNTESGIMEIAEEVGYNSDKTFRRVFKKVKGVSPSDFRRERDLRSIL